MRITLKDYGEHGAVTVFGEEAIAKLEAEYRDVTRPVVSLPEGVVKRELTIEAKPPFPKLRP